MVMAALGFEDQGAVVTRGWYRVAPGKCLRPDLPASRGGSTASARRSGPTASRSQAPREAARTGLGRLDHPVHAQRQVRADRSQGLRRQRPHRDRLRHRRNVRHRRNDGAVQVECRLAGGARTVHSSRDEHSPQAFPPKPAPAPVRLGRNLGVRPRQHALSARPQSLAADRRPHPAFVSDFLGVTKEDAFRLQKDYLQALRHHDARADGRARHEAGRLPGVRAQDRPFAAVAEPGARRRDREAARPQAHPHQRHAQARRRA